MIQRLFIIFGLAGVTGGAVLLAVLIFYDLPEPVPCKVKTTDAIIVLGGGMGERAQLAYEYFKQGVADQIFVTGDGGKVYEMLTAYRVPEAKIVHEVDAESTLENARFLKPLLQEHEIGEAVIVTSWYHANRTLKIFQATMPDIAFCVAYPDRPVELNRYEKRIVAREKLATLYVTFLRGIYCLS